MTSAKHPITVLIAEDDPDDQLLAREAAREGHLEGELKFVEDGQQLLEYLRSLRSHGPDAAGMPGLILLDLNMPRMDGREALRAIKNDPDLRRIPVVVLTSSSAEEDIVSTYDLGVNSFVIKPSEFGRFVETMRSIWRYWTETVALPTVYRGG